MPDYPTAEQLERIRAWPAGDLPGWFAFIAAAGRWWGAEPAWGWSETDEPRGLDQDRRPLRVYRIFTGGWFGNEDIIDAMKANMPCWVQCWESTRRGGQYEFRVAI